MPGKNGGAVVNYLYRDGEFLCFVHRTTIPESSSIWNRKPQSMLKFCFVRDIDEFNAPRAFRGIQITWFHWTHNLRIYIGVSRHKPWKPLVFTYPYSFSRSLRERGFLKSRAA